VKILQASKAYWPHLGGVETVVRQLAEGFVSADCESAVLVASDDRARSSEHVNGVHITRTRSFGRLLSLPVSPGYPLALRATSADALLVHEPSLLAAASMFSDRRATRRSFDRLVVWWHSDIVRQRALARAYAPIQHHLLQISDRIVVATPHHVDSSTVLGAFASKVEVIPFGLDLSRFALDEARQRRVRAIRARFSDEPLVLYVGRFARYKGLHLLTEAMEHVPDGRFLAVGDGPCRSLLVDSAAHRTGRLTLLPFAGDEELADLYWAADVFVLPSHQHSEAFGIVQLEAMACETPVVTLDLPTGVTWVNRHGETGLVARGCDVASLARAINALVADEALRRDLGRRARARVQRHFSEARMVGATLDVCRAV
jgi:rhamnosyl/mannosyltransferase